MAPPRTSPITPAIRRRSSALLRHGSCRPSWSFPTTPPSGTVLVVPHDSAFGWLNYTSREATIKFEEDISPKLRCRSPGFFRASAENLASPRVASGAFVTLCNLAPGEYDYRVELEGRQQPLLGKLVVEAQG